MRNPLADAIRDGSIQKALNAISAGADVNAREEMFQPTFLMQAAKMGNIALVRALVEAGADVNAIVEDFDEFEDPATALMYAAARKHRDVCDYLRAETSRKLRKYGDKATRLLESVGRAKRTPASLLRRLSDACLRKDDHLATRLLGEVRDINGQSRDGATPLSIVAACGNLKLTRTLLKAGANPSAPTKDGICSTDFPNITRLLLRHGALIDESNKFGQTALMSASRRGNWHTVRVLLNAGSKVGARDMASKTALMHAAQRQWMASAFLATRTLKDYVKVVDLLVGALPDARTIASELQKAVRASRGMGDEELCAELERMLADVR